MLIDLSFSHYLINVPKVPYFYFHVLFLIDYLAKVAQYRHPGIGDTESPTLIITHSNSFLSRI